MREPNVHGQISSPIDFRRLHTIVKTIDAKHWEGDSSHYQDHRYIGIRALDTEGTIIKIHRDNDEWMIHGESDSTPSMLALVEKLTDSLAASSLRHRIEVYEDDKDATNDQRSELVSYRHFDWPQAP